MPALGLDHFEGRTFAGRTLYAVLRALQALLVTWTGTCTVYGCHGDTYQRVPT